MPNPLEILLAELAAHGIELQAHGERLRYRPLAAVTPDLAARLQVHKADLLAVLRAAAGRVADADALIRGARARGDNELAEALAEAWQERLAICTADGGLTLAEAEAVALQQLQAMLAFQRSTG